MFANYTSSIPVVNSYANIAAFGNLKNLNKFKCIGGDGIPPTIDRDVTLCEYHGKTYYTTSVPIFFAEWTFQQFEEQYTGQISLMAEAFQFLKTIKQPYLKLAQQETDAQYRDLFFQDNYAFLVADVYIFFNGRGDMQEKNQELFQEATRETRNSPEYQELKEMELDNLDFFHEVPEDNENLQGQKDGTPLYIKKIKENGDDGTVQINIEEIIKISGYTFSPLIGGIPTYIPWQERVIYDKNRFITIVGSRQGGKSHVMALRALTASFKGFRRDLLVCAFLTETTGHIYKYLTRLIENFPEGTFVESKQKGWITNTMTGSRIIFRSLSKEADRIRGWTLHEIIMDECYLIADDIFESVLLPTLSTTGGPVCMISTPGPKNWFYWEVMKGKMNEPGHSYYQFTLDDNPFIVPEERERIMKRKNDPIIRREWYCEFDEMSNQVFRPEKTTDISFYTKHKDQCYFIVSYDPARKGKDRAAYSVSIVFNGEVFWVKSGAIPDSYKSTWEGQADWFLKNILDGMEEYYFVMDCTGSGDGPVSIFQAAGIKVHTAVQYVMGNTETEDLTYPYGSAKAMRVGKSRLINNTQNYLDEGMVTFYTYTNELLFFEMDGITEKRTSMGHVGFTTKGFDDITNTVMINLYLIENEGLLSKKFVAQADKITNIDSEPYFRKQNQQPKRRSGNLF